MMNSEYYDALGVSSSATKEEIQKAYRKRARKYHPDMNKDSGAEDRFKLINEAHSVLVDPEKRKLYDRYGKNWHDAQQQEGQGQRSNREGQRSNFAGGFHFEQGGNLYEQEDLSDIFSHIFGGGGRQGEDHRGGFGQTPGRTIEADLEVDLDELIHGAAKTISWSSMEQSGKSPGPKEQTVQLKVPKGLKNGSVIRLAGKGEKGRGGGPDGDLLLRIQIRPDKRFTVQDYDLVTTVPVSPWEAALGTKVAVDTIAGKINLTVPQGCNSGRKLRVKGKGLPHKDSGAGDLIVVIEIHVPRNPNEEERKLFEELARTSDFNPRRSPGQRTAEMKEEA